MMNREAEEWLNSQLNPTEIVAMEARDTPTEASTGGRTTSIQNKVVNFTSKNTESKLEKEYSMGLVLTGECIFLHDEIKNIMINEKSKMANLSKKFQDCFKRHSFVPVYSKGKSIGSLISKTKIK